MGLDSRADGRIRALSDSDNRAVLSILDDADRPLDVGELAERLVSSDVAMVTTSEYRERKERMVTALHHDHLPRLGDVGLVEYDRESNVVRRSESTEPEVEWWDAATIGDLVAGFRTDHEDGDERIGVIEGRESVIEQGRRLADEAEEELFCMYERPDLLEAECVRRGQNAIDRGVAICVGSGNPDVRELARSRLSGATVWEPQLDLLNTPSFPRVGRLVLADRRVVMVGILADHGRDGTHPDEVALVGRGEDNPLVVLVRELLGSRLDHLDYQSEHFRSELPT